jgi:hypothetical protein
MLTRSTYLDEVDLVEGVVAAGLLDVEDGDDVLVIEVAQQLHLTQRSQAEHGMVERGDLLDGNFLTGWLVYRGASLTEVSLLSVRFRRQYTQVSTYQTTP